MVLFLNKVRESKKKKLEKKMLSRDSKNVDIVFKWNKNHRIQSWFFIKNVSSAYSALFC